AATQLTGWQSGGWRIVLTLYGLLGLGLAALFAWLFRDQPSTHPLCNAAERALIGHEPAIQNKRRLDASFLVAAVTSPELWLISAMGIAVNIGWVFLVTWLPRFLVARHSVALTAIADSPEVLAGTLTALTGLGGMIGSIAG